MFCYLGKFEQAVLWPSLPDRATKKIENCHSLLVRQCYSSIHCSQFCHLMLIAVLSSKKYMFQKKFWLESFRQSVTIRPTISVNCSHKLFYIYILWCRSWSKVHFGDKRGGGQGQHLIFKCCNIASTKANLYEWRYALHLVCMQDACVPYTNWNAIYCW